MIVDANRATRNPDATGLFGTVHVMVGDLPDPIGFQIEMRQGRLTALHGQSYGQDTRAIDFSSTPFGEVFTVDARGQSVLYRPAWRAPDPVARPAPQAQTPAKPPVSAAQPADPAPASAAAPNLTEILASASNPTASRAGKLALVYLAAYALAVLFVLFAQFVLHLGWVFAAIVAAWAIRYIHSAKGRAQMADLTDLLDRNGAFEALKPN